MPSVVRFFPKLVNTAEQRTSLAVVNPTAIDVRLSFEAYADDGQLTAVSTDYVLPAAQQLARMIGEIFPQLPETFRGWMAMRSSHSQVNGFYMLFDDRLSHIDGSVPLKETLNAFVLPLKDNAEIFLGNPYSDRVTPYRLEFVSNQGGVLRSYSGSIPIRGRAVLHSADLVPDPQVPGYFRGYSEIGLLAAEEIRNENKWSAVLNGMEISKAANESYAPHYVVGEGYNTLVDIINLTGYSNTLLLELFDQQGTKQGETYVTQIPAYGSERLAGVSLFGVSPPVNGYIRMRGGRATGSVLFTDPQAEHLGSALPFITLGKKEYLFSQVAESDLFYTGLAVINLNSLPITVRIEVYDDEWGVRRAWGNIVLPAGGKFSRLLSELVGPLPDLTKGYFRVYADLPVAAFAVFGTRDRQSLSAIPQQ
jgi:hypothetical protein